MHQSKGRNVTHAFISFISKRRDKINLENKVVEIHVNKDFIFFLKKKASVGYLLPGPHAAGSDAYGQHP